MLVKITANVASRSRAFLKLGKLKVLTEIRTIRSVSSAVTEQVSVSDGKAFLDDEYQKIAEQFGVMDSFPNGHRMMVVHPKIRWGYNSASASTTAELQLEEAITLVKTIPNFSVCSSVIVGTDYNTKKKRIWGSGRVDALIEAKEKERATAIMINVPILSPLQQSELSSAFRVPVFDRYNIVLLIFKLFAKTKDAWLQIELASIPYIRHRMQCVDAYRIDPEVLHIQFPSSSKTGKFDILRLREHQIRKQIKASIEEKRNMVAEKEDKGAAATVAVVGYTNAGKSSFIKRMTGKLLYVEDRLFATLDTSAHFCRLPSGSPVYFTDTIGFISSLPIHLFASFEATLSHVSAADLLLVIEDVSHPDRLAQREAVMETLSGLKIKQSLLDTLVFVGNKVDKVETIPDEPSTHFVSCVTGQGLPELIAAIDKKVMTLGGRKRRLIKLRPGSEALSYLYRGSFLVDNPIATEDGHHLLCKFVMSEAEFAKFCAHFGIAKRRPQ